MALSWKTHQETTLIVIEMSSIRINYIKNILCWVNFFFLFLLILFDIVYVAMNAKTLAGLILATLSPVFWNEWLYHELICSSNKYKPPISCKTFLMIGLLMASSVFLSICYGLQRGTLWNYSKLYGNLRCSSPRSGKYEY